MKILLRLAKKSAKNIFNSLRSQSLLFCSALDQEICVTKLFFNHIVNNAKKKRTDYEIIERVLISTFIPKILKNGILTQERNEKYGKTFRISYKNNEDIFCIILLKSNQKLLLLSCFRKTSLYKKRTLS